MEEWCSICGSEEYTYVQTSRVAPVSYCLCTSCKESLAEPYYVLVGAFFWVSDEIRSIRMEKWKDIIEGTLKVTNKTMEQFLDDVRVGRRWEGDTR